MPNNPSNTREQCAFNRGQQQRQRIELDLPLTPTELEEQQLRRNPHAKNTSDWRWWNKGWKSV